MFFYSLVSSLLRQRALLVVRQVSGCNGLEAYRSLIQQNEPISKDRSMGLLHVIMNSHAFSGKLFLMQHVFRREHAYSEYEKLGSRLNDDLKTAILMRSVRGQLKTWRQLQVTESTTYARVGEMILLYDASATKWSEQMVQCLVQTLLAQLMGQFQWRWMKLKPKERAKVAARASQKTKAMQKENLKGSRKSRMTQKESPRMVTRKEKVMMVKDPKGKEKETVENAMYVVVQGILPVIAGSPRCAIWAQMFNNQQRRRDHQCILWVACHVCHSMFSSRDLNSQALRPLIPELHVFVKPVQSMVNWFVICEIPALQVFMEAFMQFKKLGWCWWGVAFNFDWQRCWCFDLSSQSSWQGTCSSRCGWKVDGRSGLRDSSGVCVWHGSETQRYYRQNCLLRERVALSSTDSNLLAQHPVQMWQGGPDRETKKQPAPFFDETENCSCWTFYL